MELMVSPGLQVDRWYIMPRVGFEILNQLDAMELLLNHGREALFGEDLG